MRYFIGTITDLLGEYEFATKVRFKTEGDPEAKLNDIAQSWRLEYAEFDDFMKAYDHGDGLYTEPTHYLEISQELYETLGGIITEL